MERPPAQQFAAPAAKRPGQQDYEEFECKELRGLGAWERCS